MGKTTRSKKDQYVERVRSALTMSSAMELTKAEYIDALEEIAGDIDGMLEAAREETREEGTKR